MGAVAEQSGTGWRFHRGMTPDEPRFAAYYVVVGIVVSLIPLAVMRARQRLDVWGAQR